MVDEDGGAVDDTGSPGEIQVRGGGLMTGYWGLPDATRGSYTADGWFKTGDVATVDEDGYIFLAGRSDAVFKRSGLKVSAQVIKNWVNRSRATLERKDVSFNDLTQPPLLPGVSRA